MKSNNFTERIFILSQLSRLTTKITKSTKLKAQLGIKGKGLKAKRFIKAEKS